jgi:alkylated DNA repair protein (DNA oxidative demethylase)
MIARFGLKTVAVSGNFHFRTRRLCKRKYPLKSTIPMQDLFDLHDLEAEKVALGTDAVVLRRFARGVEAELLAELHALAALAPFRNMVTPGGYTMSVAMTNCGTAGWVTDLRGYRYASRDPASGEPSPPLPATFLGLATRAAAAAGFGDFQPDACLINRYAPGTKLSLHQDKNETDYAAPIVSVSLGLPAKFLFGGLRRNDRVKRVELRHGDVVVWGRAARLAYHGVDTLNDGDHEATGRYRFNLTFRKAL